MDPVCVQVLLPQFDEGLADATALEGSPPQSVDDCVATALLRSSH